MLVYDYSNTTKVTNIIVINPNRRKVPFKFGSYFISKTGVLGYNDIKVYSLYSVIRTSEPGRISEGIDINRGYINYRAHTYYNSSIL